MSLDCKYVNLSFFFLLLFRQLNIKKVLVTGGSLDHRVVPQILNEGGGEKVTILILDEAGRVSAKRTKELCFILLLMTCLRLTLVQYLV